MELDVTVKKACQPSAMRFMTEVKKNTNVDTILKKRISSSVPSIITIDELRGIASRLSEDLKEKMCTKKVPVEMEQKVIRCFNRCRARQR
jgi:hypothetical protein